MRYSSTKIVAGKKDEKPETTANKYTADEIEEKIKEEQSKFEDKIEDRINLSVVEFEKTSKEFGLKLEKKSSELTNLVVFGLLITLVIMVGTYIGVMSQITRDEVRENEKKGEESILIKNQLLENELKLMELRQCLKFSTYRNYQDCVAD